MSPLEQESPQARGDASPLATADGTDLAGGQILLEELLEPGSVRRCDWCTNPIPASKRPDAIFCSKRCRQGSWRFGQPASRSEALGRPCVFAYADPPYPGMSARYYSEHPDYAGEVDHEALVARLIADYPDGWALSTASRSLAQVLALCPPDVRVGAWTKPYPPNKARSPRRAWEPVIFHRGRPYTDVDGDHAPLDWIHAAPLRDYPGQIVGTKPPEFSWWVFDWLNAKAPGDRLDDLFPGSGAVGRAWDRYRVRPDLGQRIADALGSPVAAATRDAA